MLQANTDEEYFKQEISDLERYDALINDKRKEIATLQYEIKIFTEAKTTAIDKFLNRRNAMAINSFSDLCEHWNAKKPLTEMEGYVLKNVCETLFGEEGAKKFKPKLLSICPFMGGGMGASETAYEFVYEVAGTELELAVPVSVSSLDSSFTRTENSWRITKRRPVRLAGG